MSAKQILFVGFGETMIDIKKYVDDDTIFFHVGYGKNPSTVYAPYKSDMCGILGGHPLFEEVVYSDAHICKFETRINIEALRKVFSGYDVRYLPTDPAQPTINVEKLLIQ